MENKMSNEEIFNEIKDNFAGVKLTGGANIILLTKNGEEFEVNQSIWDKEYEIRFHCNSTASCEDCSEHGSEKWEVFKR